MKWQRHGCCSSLSGIALRRCFLQEEKTFFQAEDGIRDRSPSRGLGDVYKRQQVERFLQTSKMMCAKTSPPEVAFNATKDDDDLFQKKRVSSFADLLKSLYAMSSRGLQNEIHGFLKLLEKVFSFCRIHLGTAMLDRELQDLIRWVSTKLEVSP